MMLRKKGIRHPQTRNWSPETALKTSPAKFAKKNPADTPSCGQEVNEAATRVCSRPLHRQRHRSAPLTTNPDALDEADDVQENGAPDSDTCIGRRGSRQSRRQRPPA